MQRLGDGPLQAAVDAAKRDIALHARGVGEVWLRNAARILKQHSIEVQEYFGDRDEDMRKRLGLKDKQEQLALEEGKGR